MFPIIDTTRHDTLCSEISAVIPSVPQDIDTLISNTYLYFKFLPIRNIYVIGPEGIAEKIKRANNDRIIFMNENTFADVPRIRELYSSLQPNNSKRAGWYIQQFIKMQFAKFTDDEYYLIWDSDTIPLKHVQLFDESSRPFFDMKTEYHVPYFETINRIFPDIRKTAEGSFISEHMLIKSEYMRELIDEIESRTEISGTNFQEKIINAIDTKDLGGSGFSEFETYGSYVIVRHPETYSMREWHSLRSGRIFYAKASDIDELDRQWLAKKYDAISLEKWQEPSRLRYVIQAIPFRRVFSPTILPKIERLLSLLKRI